MLLVEGLPEERPPCSQVLVQPRSLLVWLLFLPPGVLPSLWVTPLKLPTFRDSPKPSWGAERRGLVSVQPTCWARLPRRSSGPFRSWPQVSPLPREAPFLVLRSCVVEPPRSAGCGGLLAVCYFDSAPQDYNSEGLWSVSHVLFTCCVFVSEHWQLLRETSAVVSFLT